MEGIFAQFVRGGPSAMAKKSFYAVAKGRQTGIFRSWAECEASVKGYPSDFKGFATYEEAAAFLEQKGVSLNPPDDWAKGGRVYSSPSLASPAAVSGAVAGTKRPWADLAKDCPNQGQRSAGRLRARSGRGLTWQKTAPIRASRLRTPHPSAWSAAT